jgi:hypothetical protein
MESTNGRDFAVAPPEHGHLVAVEGATRRVHAGPFMSEPSVFITVRDELLRLERLNPSLSPIPGARYGCEQEGQRFTMIGSITSVTLPFQQPGDIAALLSLDTLQRKPRGAPRGLFPRRTAQRVFEPEMPR